MDNNAGGRCIGWQCICNLYSVVIKVVTVLLIPVVAGKKGGAVPL